MIMRRLFSCLSVLIFLSACSLPRGAALQSEVLSERGEARPSFQVVEGTRRSTPALARGPATGWKGQYSWPAASRGPDSAVLRTGDTLDVVIWDSQENSLLSGAGSKSTDISSLTVSPSGEIFMPYVGNVQVRGLSADDARQRLQDKMVNIAPSAQVQLTVQPGRNNAVDVVGGVGAPGTYPLDSRNIRILSVLAQAGGVQQSLTHPLVVLQRGNALYETRAESLFEDPSRNILVRGGDHIVVTEDNRSFNVIGAAGSQKVIKFEKETMSAMEAVSAMGGLSAARADPKGLLVLREYDRSDVNPDKPGPNMQQVIFTLDFTDADGLFAARQFEIHPNDTLLATESPVTRVQTILGLVGTVVGFSSTASTLSN